MLRTRRSPHDVIHSSGYPKLGGKPRDAVLKEGALPVGPFHSNSESSRARLEGATRTSASLRFGFVFQSSRMTT